jgi:hypothetical protein
MEPALINLIQKTFLQKVKRPFVIRIIYLNYTFFSSLRKTDIHI